MHPTQPPLPRTFILEGHFISEGPLATCSKDLKDQYEQNNGGSKVIPVPVDQTSKGEFLYFPATGIRATLRRSLRDVCRQHIIETTGNPTPFSLDDHYFLTLGGIKAAGEGDKSSVLDEENWRVCNPLLSVFGAGDAGYLSFVTGHLHVGNAICEEPVKPVTFSGGRTDDLYRNKEQTRFLTDADLDDLVKRSSGNKSRSALNGELKAAEKKLRTAQKSGTPEAIAALEAHVTRLKNQIDSVATESGAGVVSVGMPLPGYQAIPEGERLRHKFRLVNSNGIELGALLASLDQFARLPLIGAHHATGCGEVSGTWDVYEVRSTGKALLGNITLTPYEPLDLSTPELIAFRTEFDAFLQSGKANFHVPTAAAAAME